MNNLYTKAKMAWGVAMPKQLKRLHCRDDSHVYEALMDVLNDILSDNWTVDARIAWAILTGKEES